MACHYHVNSWKPNIEFYKLFNKTESPTDINSSAIIC